MPAKTLSREDVIDMMKRRQGDRSLTALAEELSLSKAYISDIFNGRRSPGPSVLKKLGLESLTKVVTTYRKIA